MGTRMTGREAGGDAAGDQAGGGGRSWLSWSALAALVLGAVAFVALGGHRLVSLTSLVEHYSAFKTYLDAHVVSGLVIYMIVYVAVTALSVPGALALTIAGGLFFGWLVGGIATLIAATVGATILFLLARTTLGQALASKAGKRLDAVRQGFREDEASYLLFLRLVPVFPFWLVNLAPALLGVSLRIFVVTTLIGIAPGTFAFSVVGAGLDSVVAQQATELAECRAGGAGGCVPTLAASDLVTPGLLAAFAALGMLALLPVAVKKVWRYRGSRAGPAGRG